MSTAPDQIRALADQRVEAKRARDFGTADRLRAEIEAAGWRILDTADGYTLAEKPAFEFSALLTQLRMDPFESAEISIGLIIDGWWSDAHACLLALLEHTDAVIYALDVSGDATLARALADFAKSHHERVQAAHLSVDPGWGPAARWLAEISTSRLHVLMDPSTLLTGRALDLLRTAIETDGLAAAGWKGALVDVADGWRSVVDQGPGEVDVLLGYLMMVRRDALLATPYPHAKARFYRNADLELSLGLRAAGGRLRALDLPVAQGRHHGYHDSDPTRRDHESKRNYDRMLTSFRGRTEVLSARNPARNLG